MNSLKPIIKKTLQVLTLFVCLNTYAQELDSNLFYCHENIEIKYLWPVGQNQFVANVRYLKNESFSGEQMYLSNMYLLFNESNLVTDTVYISSFGRSVNVLDDQTIMFTSKFGSKKYDISEEKFNQISNSKNPNVLEVIQAEEANEYMLGTFNGIEIGYISEAKNRTLKRSKKNIPRYFYIDANGNRKFINSGKEDVVNDQWESFLNKMPFALGDINLYKDELYINIPMIGTCYVFNTKNFQIKTYLLPTEDADSWFLNLDKKTVEVDTEKFETNQKGIYAVGDICTYPGKLKLILSGFHEGALAARACFKLARPNEKYRFEFTTSSKTIKDRLGVKSD